jgi:hypothetical protein
VKIIEESEARRNGAHDVSSSGTMFSKNSENREQRKKPTGNKNFGGKREGTFKFRCFKCNRPGHKAAECHSKNGSENVKCAKSVCLNTSSTRSESLSLSWCLDSGATAHLCNDIRYFRTINDSKRGTLNLANAATTRTMGDGTVEFTADVYGDATSVSLSNTLHVPDLRTNLMSIGKITDRGLEVQKRCHDTRFEGKHNVHCQSRRGLVLCERGRTRTVRDVIRSEGQRSNVGIVTSTVGPREHERHFESRVRAYRERSSSREPA